MPTYLRDHLDTVFSDEPRRRVMAPPPAQHGTATWPGSSFGRRIVVRAIVMHETSGWQARSRKEEFVTRYIVPGAARRGIGTQFFIAGDGSTYQVIDLPLLTWHSTYVNSETLGVEAGHSSDAGTLPPGNGWHGLISANAAGVPGPDPDPATPGLKLWLKDHLGGEVIFSWATTAAYRGPAREIRPANEMLFTEQHYRSWSLLARYLAEQFWIPRNVPLLPWEPMWHLNEPAAGDNIHSCARFRRIALADGRFPEILRAIVAFGPVGGAAVSEADFASDAALQPRYTATLVGAPRAHNRMWRTMVQKFRGFHGHSFGGSVTAGNPPKEDCPGPLFDFHRFARELMDWWWKPFDCALLPLPPPSTMTAFAPRPYRTARRETAMLDYYWDTDGSEQLRVVPSLLDPHSTPETYELDPQSPVYAMANGELVAARYPPADNPDALSLAFVLVRHRVFHLAAPQIVIPLPFGLPAFQPRIEGQRVDYDQAPTYFYSLYMHLGRPEGMSFDRVSDANPDWLNRVLLRHKECDLALDFRRSPAGAAIPPDHWTGRAERPDLHKPLAEVLEDDRFHYREFLRSLGNGSLALAPPRRVFTTPINIILGDFLGHGGVIKRDGGAVKRGIRVEVFSPSFPLIPPRGFGFKATNGWIPEEVAPLKPALWYASEWYAITEAQQQLLANSGADPAHAKWWEPVAGWLRHDFLPETAKLSMRGEALHFRPSDFMEWVNDTTWKSEWPKYDVRDAQGRPAPAPPRPRARNL